MSRLEQYEAGALSAWTPASQAAFNAARHDRQQEADAGPAFEAFREEEAKARKEVNDAMNIARAKGDNKEKERLKEELLKLDEIWGPELEKPLKGRDDDELNAKWGRPVGAWDDQMTAEGRLRGTDRKKKEVRVERYGAAEAISAGEVVDNLVSALREGLSALTLTRI